MSGGWLRAIESESEVGTQSSHPHMYELGPLCWLSSLPGRRMKEFVGNINEGTS